MPKILIDRSKDIEELIYAVKTCPACGSVIEFSTKDIIDKNPNENGKIEFLCPCGEKLLLYKYFDGKKYSKQEYIECLDHFEQAVTSLLWDDWKCAAYGYGKCYFGINHVDMIVTPYQVVIKLYIDKYKEGDWSKCIKENVFYKSAKFSTLNIARDLNQSALYSQALSDFIINCFEKLNKQGTNIPVENIDSTELISFFRNSDFHVTDKTLLYAKNNKF